jgi:hypothetical protein
MGHVGAGGDWHANLVRSVSRGYSQRAGATGGCSQGLKVTFSLLTTTEALPSSSQVPSCHFRPPVFLFHDDLEEKMPLFFTTPGGGCLGSAAVWG